MIGQRLYFDAKLVQKKDYGPDVKLPNGYTKLEYIRKTGTDRIDLGLTYNVDMIAGIRWQGPITGNSQWPILFGQYRTTGFSGDYYQCFTLRALDSGKSFQLFHGFNPNTTYGEALYLKNYIDDNVHDYELREESLVIDGVEKTYQQLFSEAGQSFLGQDNSKIQKTNHIYLFNDASSGRPSEFKLYNFYLRNNAEDLTLLNLIPCRNPSGTICFYDTAGQKEFTCNGLNAPT